MNDFVICKPKDEHICALTAELAETKRKLEAADRVSPRFVWMIDQVIARFPESIEPSGKTPKEILALKQIDAIIVKLEAAEKRAASNYKDAVEAATVATHERSLRESAEQRIRESQEQEPIGYVDSNQFERWDVLRGTKFESPERCYLPFSRIPFESELSTCDLPLYAKPPIPNTEAGNKYLDEARIATATSCCGYIAEHGEYPVKWNPYNRVVQCHNCGAIWKPVKPNTEKE